MTTSTVRLDRPLASDTAPLWLALPMATVGAAMAVAAWVGDPWPLTILVLLATIGVFAIVLARPAIGISLFLTTFLINYPEVAKGAGPLTINNVLGAIFLALLAWDFYRHRDAWYAREPLIWTLLVIGAVFVVGTIAAEYRYPDAAIQRLIERPPGVTAGFDFTSRWLFQFFSRIAFVVFMLRFIQTPRQLRAVFITMLLCILAAVPPALLQFAQGGFTPGEFRIDVEIVNWADNENRFAFGCILGISLLLYLIMNTRALLTRFVAVGAIALLLPLIMLAASRSGFLGLCVLGLILLSGRFGGRTGHGSGGTRVAGFAAIAGIAFLTFTFLLDPRAQERVLNINPFAEAGVEGSSSTQYRAAAVEHSLALIRMHPILGVGLGNFRWVNRYYHGFFKPPHNSYLWAAAEGGMVLLGAYLFLFTQLWRRFGRLRNAYATHADLPFFPHWLRVYMILLLFFSFFADTWIEEHVFLLVASAILLDRWQRLAAPASALAGATPRIDLFRPAGARP
jgi:hypothetical protein